MADTIQIERWHRPWEPASETRLVRTLNYYDRPLTGIVEQQGVRYLFDCIFGQIESQHVWVYRLLTDREDRDLLSADSAEKTRELVEHLLLRGPMTLAVADDDDGIWGASEILSLGETSEAIHGILAAFRSYLATKERLAVESETRLTPEPSS